MAHTIKPTLIINGSKVAVIHYYISSDGLSDDLSSEIILEPGDLNGSETKPFNYTVNQIWSTLVGFQAMLGFDSVEPQETWVLAPGGDSHVDFRCFGGLKDRTVDVDSTGALLLTTLGLQDPAAKGVVILEIKKS